jgi:2-phosphoglycerate kinase
VHYSSFEARLALTRAEEEESGDAAILGFLDQARNVVVGVQAALERAATERWSTVLEGVHLVPGMVGAAFPGAFVVQCVIAIEDENLHRSHFWVRDQSTEGLRPLEKYLDSLSQIRQIQDYLVERARRYDVPVILNDALDKAIGDVMDLVLRQADQFVGAA